MRNAQNKAPALVQGSELTFSYPFALDFRIFRRYDSYAFVTKRSKSKEVPREALAWHSNGKEKISSGQHSEGEAKDRSALVWRRLDEQRMSMAKPRKGSELTGKGKAVRETAGALLCKAMEWQRRHGTDTRRNCSVMLGKGEAWSGYAMETQSADELWRGLEIQRNAVSRKETAKAMNRCDVRGNS